MPLDKEKARNNLKDILDRMEKNTDAALLHEYYKLYKKEVPFFKRSFAAAWLFMNYDEKAPSRFHANDNISVNSNKANKKTSPQNKEKPAANQREKPQGAGEKKQDAKAAVEARSAGEARIKTKIEQSGGKDVPDSVSSEKTIVTLPEGEAKYLFFSIGKNRRLFPREIISLLMNKTSAAREDIGTIRILDNYSFIQVRDTKADEIINTITGQKFRGRTLTVNYAKTKDSQE